MHAADVERPSLPHTSTVPHRTYIQASCYGTRWTLADNPDDARIAARSGNSRPPGRSAQRIPRRPNAATGSISCRGRCAPEPASSCVVCSRLNSTDHSSSFPLLLCSQARYIHGDHLSGNLKMSGNLTAVREMLGKKSCQGKVS